MKMAKMNALIAGGLVAAKSAHAQDCDPGSFSSGGNCVSCNEEIAFGSDCDNKYAGSKDACRAACFPGGGMHFCSSTCQGPPMSCDAVTHNFEVGCGKDCNYRVKADMLNVLNGMGLLDDDCVANQNVKLCNEYIAFGSDCTAKADGAYPENAVQTCMDTCFPGGGMHVCSSTCQGPPMSCDAVTHNFEVGCGKDCNYRVKADMVNVLNGLGLIDDHCSMTKGKDLCDEYIHHGSDCTYVAGGVFPENSVQTCKDTCFAGYVGRPTNNQGDPCTGLKKKQCLNAKHNHSHLRRSGERLHRPMCVYNGETDSCHSNSLFYRMSVVDGEGSGEERLKHIKEETRQIGCNEIYTQDDCDWATNVAHHPGKCVWQDDSCVARAEMK